MFHRLDQVLNASEGDHGLCHTSGAQWSAVGPAVSSPVPMGLPHCALVVGTPPVHVD